MRKKWTPEEKLAVVLDGLKGRTVAEICREHGISDAQYYKWREEAITAMKQGLQDKRRKDWRNQSWEVERNRLLKMIGEQQLIIDIQKKFQKRSESESPTRNRPKTGLRRKNTTQNCLESDVCKQSHILLYPEERR